MQQKSWDIIQVVSKTEVSQEYQCRQMWLEGYNDSETRNPSLFKKKTSVILTDFILRKTGKFQCFKFWGFFGGREISFSDWVHVSPLTKFTGLKHRHLSQYYIIPWSPQWTLDIYSDWQNIHRQRQLQPPTAQSGTAGGEEADSWARRRKQIKWFVPACSRSGITGFTHPTWPQVPGHLSSSLESQNILGWKGLQKFI